jgi:hypothetical protein
MFTHLYYGQVETKALSREEEGVPRSIDFCGHDR